MCPGSRMNDGQPRMVGSIFKATTGWAGATRAKTKGALRDNSTKQEEELFWKSVIIYCLYLLTVNPFMSSSFSQSCFSVRVSELYQLKYCEKLCHRPYVKRLKARLWKSRDVNMFNPQITLIIILLANLLVTCPMSVACC